MARAHCEPLPQSAVSACAPLSKSRPAIRNSVANQKVRRDFAAGGAQAIRCEAERYV
jgi:hypothetical protein